jgi:uncharacterized protein YgbK (DUF1537 family)
MIASQGAPTALVFGSQEPAAIRDLNAQAVIACYKSRSVPAIEARRMASQCFQMLSPLGPEQWFFKYCSTFDSTPAGNIGPVTEEFLALTKAPFTVAIPALPVNGRTQFMGHLFVNGTPLHESSMARHPLNPMTDANLLRWLSQQTDLPLGLVDLNTVRQGPQAIRLAIAKDAKSKIFFLDATNEDDLANLAAALFDFPLLTGGSGIGAFLPKRWPSMHEEKSSVGSTLSGRTMILSGSCSSATLGQLEHLASQGYPVRSLQELDQVENDLAATRLTVISSSTAKPAEGQQHAIEAAFGSLAARALREWKVDKFIVAGGETSGAVVSALQVPAARIVSVIAPGVPALFAHQPRPLGLALKSGNFGGKDFFPAALEHLQQMEIGAY